MRCIPAVALLLVATPIVAEAQIARMAEGSVTATQENQLRLSTTERRQTFRLPVDRPGRVRVQTMWTGPAQRIEVSIIGRDGSAGRARRIGSSPLTVELDVTEAQLRSGA